MSLLAIILTILLIWWVLGPVLKRIGARLLMWLIQHRMRRQMNDAFGFDPFGGSRQYGPSGSQSHQQPRRGKRKSKVFTKDMGEYVEFEDIQEYRRDASAEQPRTDIKPEPQITDAEWEDVK